jgi:hypothetical protein
VADAARQLPPGDDEVRARAHALLDQLLDLVRPPAPVPAPPPPAVLPLTTAAAQLGWTRRRLRDYCLAQGVAVRGTGQQAAVVQAELEAALAGQPKVKHDAPSRSRDNDAKRSFDGGV